MNKFKLFAAFAVGGAVLAIAAGSAAGLGVGLGQIQQGTLSNVQCDTNGVTIRWETTGEFQVQHVFVDGLDVACAGGEMDVVVKDTGGTIIWKGASDVPTSFPGGELQAGLAWGTSTLDATHTLSPAAIGSVQVTVYDTYSND